MGALISFIVAFLLLQRKSHEKILLCSAHLAVEEAETDFGAVNHTSVVLHIDAAFFPAICRVIGKWWVPFDVLYRLQIFVGHFLQSVNEEKNQTWPEENQISHTRGDIKLDSTFVCNTDNLVSHRIYFLYAC